MPDLTNKHTYINTQNMIFLFPASAGLLDPNPFYLSSLCLRFFVCYGKHTYPTVPLWLRSHACLSVPVWDGDIKESWLAACYLLWGLAIGSNRQMQTRIINKGNALWVDFFLQKGFSFFESLLVKWPFIYFVWVCVGLHISWYTWVCSVLM